MGTAVESVFLTNDFFGGEKNMPVFQISCFTWIKTFQEQGKIPISPQVRQNFKSGEKKTPQWFAKVPVAPDIPNASSFTQVTTVTNSPERPLQRTLQRSRSFQSRTSRRVVQFRFTDCGGAAAQRRDNRRLLVSYATNPKVVSAPRLKRFSACYLPKPDDDDSLSASDEESACSWDSPSIKGMDSSEDGTEDS